MDAGGIVEGDMTKDQMASIFKEAQISISLINLTASELNRLGELAEEIKKILDEAKRRK